MSQTTMTIDADPAHPWPLAEQPRDLGRFELVLGPDKRLDLRQFLQATATDAFLVLVDGRIVHESYGNGQDPGAPHMLRSVSKAITGLVAGILQYAGRLDPETLVSDVVPEVAATSYRGATLRHLLDMRAGALFDPATLATYADATEGDRLGDFHAFFAGMTEAAGSHGGAFKYDSANTDLLAWAIERVTGQPFAALTSTLLWKPMGAAAPALVTVDRHGAPRCAGGLHATARDIARLGQLVIDKGCRESRQVVAPEVIEDLWNGGDPQAWKNGEFATGFAALKLPNMSYRNGWYSVADAPRMLFAMGTHGQNLFVVPDERLVIVKLSSLADRLDRRAIALAHMAVPAIIRCLRG